MIRKQYKDSIYIYLIHLKKYGMSQDKSSSSDDPLDLFVVESKKLQNKINSMKNSGEFSISQIIETYHQVINVTSMGKMLNENSTQEENFPTTIQETEKFIKEKFNKTLHPQISSYLQESIENLRNDLKNISKNRENKTKTEIENQAKMFERLREFMSTQEFVEQYNKVSTK